MSESAVQAVVWAMRGQQFSTPEIRRILIELRVCWREADEAIEEVFLRRPDARLIGDERQ